MSMLSPWTLLMASRYVWALLQFFCCHQLSLSLLILTSHFKILSLSTMCQFFCDQHATIHVVICILSAIIRSFLIPKSLTACLATLASALAVPCENPPIAYWQNSSPSTLSCSQLAAAAAVPVLAPAPLVVGRKMPL